MTIRCPHCDHEFDPKKGGLTLVPDLDQSKPTEEESKTPKSGGRGKAREYSQAFNIAWQSYGRKIQKFEAFAVWLLRAKEVGGEAKLLTLILTALKWQSFEWAPDGWKFAPYFERYLKRRKWEDEPPPQAQAVPRPIDRSAETTDRKIAEYRAAQGKPLTPEQLADIKRRSVG